VSVFRRAADEIRTHDNNVGNVVLYQLSYSRICFSVGQVAALRMTELTERGNYRYLPPLCKAAAGLKFILLNRFYIDFDGACPQTVRFVNL
jgi:hypothetical protein